jgi:hypothetical protein
MEESSDAKKPSGNELIGFPGSYKNTNGQLTLLEYAVVYKTADGKKAEIKLVNIVDVAPFDHTDKQGGIVPSVAITSQKIAHFGFTSNSARTERDLWLRKLREQIDVVRKVSGGKRKLSSAGTSEEKGAKVQRVDVEVERVVEEEEFVYEPKTESEKRAMMLLKNPELKAVYEDLVLKGNISEKEFWSNAKYSSLPRREFSSEFVTEEVRMQRTGLGTALVSDLNPIVGEKAVEFNLSPNMMHDILAHYPAIRRAYDDNVPHKLSESGFWNEVMRSLYFNRKLVRRSALDPMEDIGENEQSDFLSRYQNLAEMQEERMELDIEESNNPLKKKSLLAVRQSVDLTVEDQKEGAENLLPKDDKIRYESKSIIKKLQKHADLVLGQTDAARVNAVETGVTAESVSKSRDLAEISVLDDLVPESTSMTKQLKLNDFSSLKKFKQPITSEGQSKREMVERSLLEWAQNAHQKSPGVSSLSEEKFSDELNSISQDCYSMYRASQAQTLKNSPSLFMFKSAKTGEFGKSWLQKLSTYLTFL